MTIQDVVTRSLGKALVREVRVEGPFGEEGERILRVYVTFDDGEGSPEAKAVLELPMELNDLLRSKGEDVFPVVSYLALSEVHRPNVAE